MNQLNSLNQVEEFHNTFKHPVLHTPTIPSEDRCKLRVSLLAEELNELDVALQNKNIVEVADALCDLQYVLSGAILEFGFGYMFSELFDEVHRSNMSKACPTLQDAENTISHYESLGQSSYYELQDDGTYLIYRTSDNKTLKSVSYSPANLGGII
jgi:predicted HAD superfamily Cof-like phosphohydrolase